MAMMDPDSLVMLRSIILERRRSNLDYQQRLQRKLENREAKRLLRKKRTLKRALDEGVPKKRVKINPRVVVCDCGSCTSRESMAPYEPEPDVEEEIDMSNNDSSSEFSYDLRIATTFAPKPSFASKVLWHLNPMRLVRYILGGAKRSNDI